MPLAAIGGDYTRDRAGAPRSPVIKSHAGAAYNLPAWIRLRMEVYMQSRILVTYCAPYDMKTEDGTRRAGVSVQYIFFGENGEELQPKQVDFTQPNGWRTARDSLDSSLISSFVLIPGVYDGEFSMRVGSDGRPVNRLVGLKYVGSPSISVNKSNFSSYMDNVGKKDGGSSNSYLKVKS